MHARPDTESGAATGRGSGALPARRPTETQLAAWRSFLQAHARLIRRLEADLVAEHGLPLASYDVLVQLVEAPGRRLRMAELADRVLVSRSGMTRLVDRLVGEGLVTREPCAEDGRGLLAALTDAGYERLRSAAVTHLRGVDAYATGRLTGPELEQLGAIMRKLTDD